MRYFSALWSCLDSTALRISGVSGPVIPSVMLSGVWVAQFSASCIGPEGRTLPIRFRATASRTPSGTIGDSRPSITSIGDRELGDELFDPEANVVDYPYRHRY